MPLDLNTYRDTYLRLTFLEASILSETIMQDTASKTTISRQQLFSRILKLKQNTVDPTLKSAADTLFSKLANLHPNVYAQLCSDATEDAILFPPNYRLPVSFEPEKHLQEES